MTENPPEAPEEHSSLPLSRMRRLIARHLTKTVSSMIPVTLCDDFEVTALYEARKERMTQTESDGRKLTYLPFFIKAAVSALQADSRFNATLEESTMDLSAPPEDRLAAVRYTVHSEYNIGYAVDTPDGLMVLNVKQADTKSLGEIAAEIEEKSARLRTTRKVSSLEDVTGGTFTISNIGALGASYSTPLMNYPEVAILAPGRMREQVALHKGKVVMRNNIPVIVKMLPVSLTFDHTWVDGADAARFLQSFGGFLGSQEELSRL